jgi:hypothetical protein
MSAYTRLKRYRERRSFERERFYLLKDWAALGTDPKTWTARQCASRKRWWIYYHRRRQERQSGFPLSPIKPRQVRRSAKAMAESVTSYLKVPSCSATCSRSSRLLKNYS